MVNIAITNGSVEYDGAPILTDINFNLCDKDKIAIIGRNGCGKTTLLNVLSGKLDMVEGTGEANFRFVKSGNINISYLEQVQDANITFLDEIKKAYKDIIKLEEEMNKALSTMQDDCSDKNIKRYTDLMDKYDALGGYAYEKEYMSAVLKFGFTKDDLSKKLSQFSGGENTKIALIRLLLSKPDVLLLDEPTNHLDIEAIMWLENYLKNYKKACVIVSHDRMFLDRIVNVVYEIEYGEMTRYSGNYTDYIRQKKENYEKALKDSEAKKKEINRLQKLVDRFRYKATKASMAQSKLKQIEKMGTVDEPNRYDLKTFHAAFQPLSQSALKVVTVNGLKFGYTEPFGDLTFNVYKNDKIGIIGANGSGKSTLIHTMMNFMKPISGKVSFDPSVKIGYFDQTLTQSNSEQTILEDFLSEYSNMSEQEARTNLGTFMFSGEDVFKRICDLSGGEKVRYAFCKIFKKRPNLLIFDEPTNHLDIVGKEALEDMLKDYKGTIIVVSHDRYFINKICNKLIVFAGNEAKFYDCNYGVYEAKLNEQKT